MIGGPRAGGRIGYVPLSPDLSVPGDRRRFPRYAAARGIEFKLAMDFEGLDLVVLSSEVDITRWVGAPTGIGVILDLPDAFLDERRTLRSLTRGLAKWMAGPLSHPVLDHRRAVIRLIQRADAVVCSTPEQADKLERFTGNAHVVLDLHGEVEPLAPRSTTGDGRLEVVWEGLHPTLVAIEQVLPALRRLGTSSEVTLNLVTDLRSPRFMNRFGVREVAEVVAGWGIDVRFHEWSVRNLRNVATTADLAIVPVELHDPYTVGKPENRMRIFWRLGLPVVASDTPSHRRAMNVAGLSDRALCTTADDWMEALGRYAEDHELRSVDSELGYVAALGPYGDPTVLAGWDEVLSSLGEL
jgi:hypothetical protein